MVGRLKLDITKLKCMSISPKYGTIMHQIPLQSYLEKVILEGEDDLIVSPETDKRLLDHKLHIFLGKEYCPPMIYIYIDDEFAAQYSYFDEEFAKRSDEDLLDEMDPGYFD